MENLLNLTKIAGGILCGVATYLFGGFDAVLAILLAGIALDYLTGVLCAMSERKLSSEIGFRGIVKKAAMLLVVAAAHLAGAATGIAEIRSVVIGFYIANECISVLENAGRLGIPLPKKLEAVLLQLRDAGDGSCGTN